MSGGMLLAFQLSGNSGSAQHVNWFEATYKSEENVSLSELDLAAPQAQRAMAVARLLRSSLIMTESSVFCVS